MLEEQFDEVIAAFAPMGLVDSGRRTEGDWAALLLRKAPDG